MLTDSFVFKDLGRAGEPAELQQGLQALPSTQQEHLVPLTMVLCTLPSL